jgi:hypothetical protein
MANETFGKDHRYFLADFPLPVLSFAHPERRPALINVGALINEPSQPKLTGVLFAFSEFCVSEPCELRELWLLF